MAFSKKNRILDPLKSAFYLTPGERLALAGILVIALIGIFARHQHLKNQTPRPVNEEAYDRVTNIPEASYE